VEYEVNVYELKSGQTPEEAVVLNDVLVTRTVTDATKISASDSDFFKVFSAKKTYVMTLSTSVNSESNFYHFENGNEALPIIFKIVK
jgi:predicted P-loop ATPase/GTPase